MAIIQALYGEFIVDDADAEMVSAKRWVISIDPRSTYRAVRHLFSYKNVNSSCLLHHFLIGRPLRGLVCDHINGNALDNRRFNIRIVTHEQNSMNLGLNKNNELGVRGVRLNKRSGGYMASLRSGGKQRYLGTFKTIEEASACRRAAEIAAFGQFSTSVSRGS